MEINSNIRNKPPADWISNKNAIASNNVSFASNVVRCFHWLCWLLKNKPCLLHIERAIFDTFCLLFLFFFFFSSVSTVNVMTCDLQVNQSQLRYSTRQEVWIWGSKEENLIRNLPLRSRKKNAQNLLFFTLWLHTTCTRLLSVYIAVQCCQFSVFSKMLQWRRRKNPARTYSGWTCQRLVCRRCGGGWIQYNVMRRRSTALRGRGEVKNSSPHGVKDLLFSSSFVLLRGLGRCALGLAVLGGRGFAAPGGIGAESWGAVEVILVVQAVGGVVLRVLQTSDQTLVLVPKLAAHQGRLAHHHHILEREWRQIDKLKKRKHTNVLFLTCTLF